MEKIAFSKLSLDDGFPQSYNNRSGNLGDLGDDGFRVTASLSLKGSGSTIKTTLSQMVNGGAQTPPSVSKTLYKDGSVRDGSGSRGVKGLSQGLLMSSAANYTDSTDASNPVIGTLTIGTLNERPQSSHTPKAKPELPIDGAAFGRPYQRPQIPQAHLDPPQPDEFQIFVRNVNTKVYIFKVTRECKVETLMYMIKGRLNVPIEQQVLTYNAKTLQCGKTLGDYGITANADIYMIVRLEGGCE